MLLTPGFGCVENRESPIAIVGVPLDHTGTYRPGSRYAPQRIREASCNLELYSLFTNTVLEDLGFKDYGDLVLPPGDVAKSVNRIEVLVKNILEEHSGLFVFLGGEHLITYPIVRVLRNKINTLIVFDAHLDMREEYLGSNLNHATYLRHLVKEGIQVVHIGSRAYSKGELEYARERNINVVNVLEVLRGKLRLNDLGSTYISIDMDVFDPSIAPGVSNPEPFGLSNFIFAKILEELYNKSHSIIGIDIVEVNPLFDVGDVTSLLAAKIVVESTGLYLRKMRSA